MLLVPSSINNIINNTYLFVGWKLFEHGHEIYKQDVMPGMVAHICNPSLWETEAEGSSILGQPGLKNLSPKNLEKKKQDDMPTNTLSVKVSK
jgi:hypothetical protein